MAGGYKLKDAVLEGGVPFNKVHGMHAFEYPAKDSRFNQVFNIAMYNHTTIVINEIVKSYDGFKHLEHKRLVDVGGGLVMTLGIITSKYPAIKGVNFDLPHAVEHAPAYPVGRSRRKSNLVTQQQKWCPSQWLRRSISKLIRGSDTSSTKLTMLHLFSNEMEVQGDVLHGSERRD